LYEDGGRYFLEAICDGVVVSIRTVTLNAQEMSSVDADQKSALDALAGDIVYYVEKWQPRLVPNRAFPQL